MRFILLATLALPMLLPAEELRWFKGNTHAHSLWSDGNDFPDMISAWYKEQGYHFLALSDHDTLATGERWVKKSVIEKKKIALGPTVLDKYRARFGHAWVETREISPVDTEVRLKTLEEYRTRLEEPGKFLLVQAEEISTGFGKTPIHINAINVSSAIRPKKDIVSIRETIRIHLQAVAEQASQTGKPIMAHINHPNFKWALTADDLAHVVEDRFFEIFNGHPGTLNEGHPDRVDSTHERLWDIANTIRISELKQPPLFGMATDDSHHYHGGTVTPGRGWVMVHAVKLEPDALVAAMQNGAFYASTGVSLDAIHFDQSSRRLQLKIHPEPNVTYRTEFRGTLKNYDHAVKEVPSPAGDPQPIRLQHGDDIGLLLASSNSLEPLYQLTGNELYVRAVIVSDQVMENPYAPGQKQQAWTQPVGW